MVELKVKLLKTWKEKVVGLLNSPKAHPVLLHTRSGIHTFGMKFPIDVLILDRNDKVIKMKKLLTPGNIFLWSPLYDQVVELPAGEIEKNSIKIGDSIKLIITH